jgi:hypothetical protein
LGQLAPSLGAIADGDSRPQPEKERSGGDEGRQKEGHDEGIASPEKNLTPDGGRIAIS